MTIPQGRLRRTAPLAAVSARAAGGGVIEVLRRRLKGERGASIEFHIRNAERYADVLSRSKGVLMKVGQIVSFLDIPATGLHQRTPLVLGSAEDVVDFERFAKDSA